MLIRCTRVWWTMWPGTVARDLPAVVGHVQRDGRTRLYQGTWRTIGGDEDLRKNSHLNPLSISLLNQQRCLISTLGRWC